MCVSCVAALQRVAVFAERVAVRVAVYVERARKCVCAFEGERVSEEMREHASESMSEREQQRGGDHLKTKR